MAEPYDTINALGNGPQHWWRFSVASGNVTDEGTGTARDLAPQSSNTGAFNGTYRFDTNPFGDGFGVRFNGQGGFEGSSIAMAGTRGTMFVVYRTVGTPSTDAFHFGFDAGFDIDYCHLAIGNGSDILYRIQDAGADDEIWFSGDVSADNSAVHSMSVSNPADSTSDAIMSFDGSSLSVTFNGDDDVPNNHWWNNFVEQVHVGVRGSVDTLAVSNLIAYELLLFDTVLTTQELSDAHDILTTFFVTPLAKHQRRRGRRVFNGTAL